MKCAAAGMIVGGVFAAQAGAANIVLDYTHDTFFGSNAVAKAALEKAALDVSNVLTTSLGATTDTSTGSFGETSASFNFRYTYTNPTTGSSTILNSTALPADEVRIFVGARTLGGSTLGEGGPAAPGFQFSGSGFSDEWVAAVDNASAAANANVGRGDGPVIGTIAGSSSLGGTNASFSVSFGAAFGNLWFDDDTNWHFDHTTAVGAGKADLYSVALHEILHSIGFSSADSFEDRRAADINDWTGPAVLALLGTGDEVLTSDGHIAEGMLSRRLFDLAGQEAAMDPTITLGTRKFITELDLAFLQDMGWDVVAIPEPSSVVLLAGAPLLLLGRRRRRSAAA
jgi:hypothetical protein